PPASVAGDLVNAPLTIRSVELAQAAASIIEEQIRVGCPQMAGNNKRPVFRVGGAGELVDAALAICAVELAQSTAAIIEEQIRVASGGKFAGNNVRPTLGVGVAGELVDA